MMILGERGGMELGPENTISTIEKSLATGATGVHVDIRCSMDDLPLLMHDATVDRTTDGGGEVFRMNLDVLVRLGAGGGVHVPSLSMALDALQKSKCNLFLELKHPATVLPTVEMIDYYQNKKGYTQGRVVIVSQYHQLVALVRDKYPKIMAGAMVKKIPDSLAACGEYTKSNYVLPPIDLLTDEFMADAKKRDLMVVATDCATKEQIAKARAFNVQGVITPNPSLA